MFDSCEKFRIVADVPIHQNSKCLVWNKTAWNNSRQILCWYEKCSIGICPMRRQKIFQCLLELLDLLLGPMSLHVCQSRRRHVFKKQLLSIAQMHHITRNIGMTLFTNSHVTTH